MQVTFKPGRPRTLLQSYGEALDKLYNARRNVYGTQEPHSMGQVSLSFSSKEAMEFYCEVTDKLEEAQK